MVITIIGLSLRVSEYNWPTQCSMRIVDNVIYQQKLNGNTNTNFKIVQVGPKKYTLPATYKQYGLDFYNFEARPHDVYLFGQMRSGTTLCGEIIWLLGHDLDYEAAKKSEQWFRFSRMDFCLFSDLFKQPTEVKEANDYTTNIAQELSKLSIKELDERQGSRFLKCHLPISLISSHIFETGAKAIYCARNPKDLIVSHYYYVKFMKLPSAPNFGSFFEYFKNNLYFYCPYFEHVKEAWARRTEENFLFIFYEELIQDQRRTILKIAKFLGKELSSDQLDTMEDYLNIDNFRKNKSVNLDFLVELRVADGNTPFIRNGKPGNWREYFIDDLEKEVDDWIEENLKDTDLRFPEN